MEICKATTTRDPVAIGSYRGFLMKLSFDYHEKEHRIALGNKGWHTAALGADVFGNLTRIDNLLDGVAARAERCAVNLTEVRAQAEKAEAEAAVPFAHEQELAGKTARLAELKTVLQLEQPESVVMEDDTPEEEEASEPKKKTREQVL